MLRMLPLFHRHPLPPPRCSPVFRRLVLPPRCLWCSMKCVRPEGQVHWTDLRLVRGLPRGADAVIGPRGDETIYEYMMQICPANFSCRSPPFFQVVEAAAAYYTLHLESWLAAVATGDTEAHGNVVVGW